jgi:hypothetical protein
MRKKRVFAFRVPEKLKDPFENGMRHKKHLKGKKKEDIIKGFDEVMGKVKKRDVEDWDKL